MSTVPAAHPAFAVPVGVAAADRPGPGHRRVPPVLLDPGRPGLPGLVRGRGRGDRQLRTDQDRNGNLWAWWDASRCRARPRWPPGATWTRCRTAAPTTGRSGVVSAFAAIDELRAEGFTPARPIAVAAFTDEEGAPLRRRLPGQPPAHRRDRRRAGPGAARRRRGHAGRGDAGGRARIPGRSAATTTCSRGSACYVELHVEQGRALADLDAALGIAEGIWPHGRWRLDFAGQADHAGTAALADRRDPMIPYAATVLAARAGRGRTRRAGHDRQGDRRAGRGQRGRAPRCAPGWTSAPRTGRTLEDTVDQILSRGRAGGRREPGRPDRPPGVVQPRGRVRRPAGGPAGGGAGRAADRGARLPTGAGHDAGVLAARLPTAMLFVRNPTGVSHSPAEHAEDADCAAGVAALAAVLRDLAG